MQNAARGRRRIPCAKSGVTVRHFCHSECKVQCYRVCIGTADVAAMIILHTSRFLIVSICKFASFLNQIRKSRQCLDLSSSKKIAPLTHSVVTNPEAKCTFE